MDIAKDLVKFNDSELPENFVAIATQVCENLPTHAGILIRHKKINYLHHYPGDRAPLVVPNFNENGWYIYKIWEIINFEDESEVASFLQHCFRICGNTEITYSYIMDKSKYDSNGTFVTKSGLPEFGTCVGFCVNTLSNYIIDGDSYFHLDDWDASNVDKMIDAYGIKQAEKKYPNLDWTLYNALKKRITPTEYLCSAFFTKKYPIKKKKIAEIETEVLKAVQDKFTP